jgi:hypothetical protein
MPFTGRIRHIFYSIFNESYTIYDLRSISERCGIYAT